MKRRSLCFLAVTGRDRPGIIARVSEVLFRQGCNLQDMSMTILDGRFAMMLIFEMPDQTAADRVRQAIRTLEAKSSLRFFWQNLSDFKERPARRESEKNTAAYLIRALGPDQTGIVYHISRILAAQGLNITDLNSKILRGPKRRLYALMLETTIPAAAAESQADVLRRKLVALGRKIGVDISLTRVETVLL